MKNALLLLTTIALSAAGCKKKAEGPAGDAPQAQKAVAPAPFTGELTVDILKSAKGTVQPFDAFDEALPKLKAKLGQPTSQSDKEVGWALLAGDKCAYIKVENDGGKVGMVDGPNEVDKLMKSMYADCAKVAGVEAKEDANAPAPPTDGTPVTPDQLIAGVANAKSKWLGQKVVLRGVFINASTSTSGGTKTVILSLRTSKDSQDSVGCQLPDGSDTPTIFQGRHVTVKGTVNDMFDGGLENCEIVTIAEK